MKIYLIGFMGCGKTTVGKLLAAHFSFDFIDLDNHIETEYGKSISKIFETENEVRFRKLETTYLNKISSKDNRVIATGGGTPCYNQNIEFINKNGISVYLKMSSDNLFDRLKNEKNNRPLLKNLSDIDFKKYILEKLIERESYYLQANHIISIENRSVEKIISLLSEKINFISK